MSSVLSSWTLTVTNTLDVTAEALTDSLEGIGQVSGIQLDQWPVSHSFVKTGAVSTEWLGLILLAMYAPMCLFFVQGLNIDTVSAIPPNMSPLCSSHTGIKSTLRLRSLLARASRFALCYLSLARFSLCHRLLSLSFLCWSSLAG